MNKLRKLINKFISKKHGSSMVEFAIIAPVIMSIIAWSIYFSDLLYVKLKNQEAARYVAWEFTAFSLSDYENSQHRSAFNNAKKEIVKEAQEKYKNLNSTNTGAPAKLLSFKYTFNKPFVGNVPAMGLAAIAGNNVANHNVMNALAGNNAFGGINPSNMMSSLTGTISNFLSHWKFNSNGKAFVTSSTRPGRAQQPGNLWEFVLDLLGISGVKETITLIADPWVLMDGKDVHLPGGYEKGKTNSPFFKQVKRIAFLGLNAQIIDPINNVTSIFLGKNTEAFVTKLVSLNYKNESSGKVDLSDESKLKTHQGVIKYDTAPLENSNNKNNSLYYQTLNQRGKHYMGCKDEQEQSCWH